MDPPSGLGSERKTLSLPGVLINRFCSLQSFLDHYLVMGADKKTYLPNNGPRTEILTKQFFQHSWREIGAEEVSSVGGSERQLGKGKGGGLGESSWCVRGRGW